MTAYEPLAQKERGVPAYAAALQRYGVQWRPADRSDHDGVVTGREATEADPRLAPPIVHEVLNGSGQPLNAAVRETMGARFGFDFASVRIHADGRAAASARAVAARAYTVGRDIVFGTGEYQPDTVGGRALLSHELAHVVQQRHHAGWLPSDLQIGDPADDHERHAERLAHHIGRSPAALGRTSNMPAIEATGSAGSGQPIVRRCGPTPCDCTDEEREARSSPLTAVRVQRSPQEAPPRPTMTPEEYEAESAALCVGDRYNTGPPTRPFTPREQARVTASRWAALSVSGRAVQALSSHDPYIATLARRILHEANPDIAELTRTASRIHAAVGGTPIVRGTCTNERCGHGGGGSPLADATSGLITICPHFFSPSLRTAELLRTWLHEAGHIIGIDDPPSGVLYQHPPNCPEGNAGGCVNPCPRGDKHNVDNWMHFLECVAASR